MFDIERQLRRWEKRGFMRSLRTFEQAAKPVTMIEGKEMLLFSSNNYLGFTTDERLQKEAIKAIEKYGTGSGGSRLTTGNYCLHEALEKEIAQFKGKEAALVFSSGYLANIGVISSLMKRGDIIVSDEWNHASIVDGCTLSKAETIVYKHVDMEDLERKLQQAIVKKSRNGRILIVTDGVFSMDGDMAPLEDIVHLAKKYEAFVMVDDAHGTGVIGETGAGTAEYFGVTDEIDLHVGTLSKAIGGEGGYVAASNTLIRYFHQQARSFIFQTSLSPAMVATALRAIQLLPKETKKRNHLRNLTFRLREELMKANFIISPVDDPTPITSVILGDAKKAVLFSKKLADFGIYAPAIRPPTVPLGKSRIRLTLMATHTEAQVDQLIHAFRTIGQEMEEVFS